MDIINFPLSSYLYAYRLLCFLTLIRDSYFCSRLIQKFTIVDIQRTGDCGVLCSKWDIYIVPCPHKAQGSSLKRGRETVRATGGRLH